MNLWLIRLCRAVIVVGLLAFVGGVAGVTIGFFTDEPAQAQTRGEVPGAAIGSANDAETWRMIRRGARGTVSHPVKRTGVMITSSGQGWRAMRDGFVTVFGLIAIGGILLALLAFYLVRGRIPIEAGFSGRTVLRFNSLERFVHWVTASSFVVLGLTGLNMLYGRDIIKPIIGGNGFSTVTEWGKYAHDFVGFAFIAGIIMILIIWVRDNMPRKIDIQWLAKGGGMFSKGVHPPAQKFNAGQKIIFWLTILAGGSLAFTGVCLLFPLTFAPFSWSFAVLNFVGFDLPASLTLVQEMQLTQLWHAILALTMIAIILAHIYIGWLGMEGAYDAVGTGYVDENWAREHHSLWMAETKGGDQSATQPGAGAQPSDD